MLSILLDSPGAWLLPEESFRIADWRFNYGLDVAGQSQYTHL